MVVVGCCVDAYASRLIRPVGGSRESGRPTTFSRSSAQASNPATNTPQILEVGERRNKG